jgi:hypothetical protein
MSTYRVYEVQYEVITHRWIYEIEASDENAAMALIHDGQLDPVDCGTIDEPFHTDSGFAVQRRDADSDVGWDRALKDLNESNPRDVRIPFIIDAIEAALNYFEDTRHGKEWIETGGVEAKMLREALNTLRAKGTA